MKLDDAQKKTVIGWIDQGLKLAEIQKRLSAELGLNPTYMELRFLVDDLKVMPKDPEPPKQEPAPAAPKAPAAAEGEEGYDEATPAPAPAAGGTGKVSVSLDQITRPGAMISGKVTFSDGNTAEWYLDQMGRLGVVPAVQGYKPTQEDVQSFQMELQAQIQKMGF